MTRGALEKRGKSRLRVLERASVDFASLAPFHRKETGKAIRPAYREPRSLLLHRICCRSRRAYGCRRATRVRRRKQERENVVVAMMMTIACRWYRDRVSLVFPATSFCFYPRDCLSKSCRSDRLMQSSREKERHDSYLCCPDLLLCIHLTSFTYTAAAAVPSFLRSRFACLVYL